MWSSEGSVSQDRSCESYTMCSISMTISSVSVSISVSISMLKNAAFATWTGSSYAKDCQSDNLNTTK